MLHTERDDQLCSWNYGGKKKSKCWSEWKSRKWKFWFVLDGYFWVISLQLQRWKHTIIFIVCSLSQVARNFIFFVQICSYKLASLTWVLILLILMIVLYSLLWNEFPHTDNNPNHFFSSCFSFLSNVDLFIFIPNSV